MPEICKCLQCGKTINIIDAWSRSDRCPSNPYCETCACPTSKCEIGSDSTIRTFPTGATRDTTEGKLSYVKGLSPIVLRRYLQYLAKHRKQPDGSIREFDNWKQGIPKETYLDSLVRHVVDTWLMMQGFSAEDNHGPCNLEEVLCAVIFNSSGILHELLKGKDKNDIERVCPIY